MHHIGAISDIVGYFVIMLYHHWLLEPYWNQIGVILGPCWITRVMLVDIKVSSWCHVDVFLRSICWESSWGHLGVIFGSLLVYLGAILESSWDHDGAFNTRI